MYTSSVDLGPPSTLARVSQAIDTIQQQQHDMTYAYEAASIPSNSCFAPSLQQMGQLLPLIEAQIVGATWWLENLVEQTDVLQMQGWSWLFPGGNGEDDASEDNLVFQIETSGGTRSLADVMAGKGGSALDDVEMLVHRQFNRGLVLVVVYFGGSFYVSVCDAEGADQSLMATRFPDFARKGQGCQIKSYANGCKDWPTIRKLALWQLVPSSEGAQQYQTNVSSAPTEAGSVEAKHHLPIGPAAPKTNKGRVGVSRGQDSKQMKATATQTYEEKEGAVEKSQPQTKAQAKYAEEKGSKATPKSLAPLVSPPHTRLAPLGGGGTGRRMLPWDRLGRPVLR
jgi:hypothetical protein